MSSVIRFGLFAEAVVTRLPNGKFRHSLRLLNAPFRCHSASVRPMVFNRVNLITAHSQPVRTMEVIFIGQLLVTMCIEAIAAGEVTKSEVATMNEIAKEIWGKDWTYRSREAQHAVVNRLFALTGNPDHYYNDVRTEL